MNDDKIITLLIVCTISGIVLGMSIVRLIMTPQMELYRESLQVVAECEKEIPRSQSCELIISAKVKGDEKQPSN